MKNLLPDIRSALLGLASVQNALAQWEGSPTVFTRRPVPGDALYPMILVQMVSGTDVDGLTARRPVQTYDVIVYGRQKEDLRAVEEVSFSVRNFFQRNRFAIALDDCSVVLITCSGPRIAPSSDESLVARMVTLTITLKEEN